MKPKGIRKLKKAFVGGVSGIGRLIESYKVDNPSIQVISETTKNGAFEVASVTSVFSTGVA